MINVATQMLADRMAYREARNRAASCKHGVQFLESVQRFRPEVPSKRYPNRIFEIVWCEPCQALKFSCSTSGEPKGRRFVESFPGPMRWDGKPLI